MRRSSTSVRSSKTTYAGTPSSRALAERHSFNATTAGVASSFGLPARADAVGAPSSARKRLAPPDPLRRRGPPAPPQPPDNSPPAPPPAAPRRTPLLQGDDSGRRLELRLAGSR